jgi:NAD(P)-dependent dehydrogenase (short-subunit alcohol dehydrogenase family)
VLITGSTDGVGRLVATRAVAAGAQVLVHGRSDSQGGDTVGKIQREAPRSHVEYYRADLASLDDVRRLADEVMSAHDRLDILINNAGIGFGPPVAAERSAVTAMSSGLRSNTSRRFC